MPLRSVQTLTWNPLVPLDAAFEPTRTTAMSDLLSVLTPDELRKLQEMNDTKSRLKLLDERLAGLSLEADAKALGARQAYRDRYATRFTAYDWKKALLGASVEHAFVVETATYHLRLPSAGVTRGIQRLLGADFKELHPITEEDAVVLGWLVGVSMADKPRVDLSKLDLKDKLASIRQLPDLLLRRLADECQTLQAWLNVQLELNAGNS